MESHDVLDSLRIASPCPASWESMQGDERIRFCSACSKNVYNISELKADDAASLIRETEGRVCVRLYRRSDGTVLTADCPVGIRAAVRRRLIRMTAAAAVLLGALRSGIWVFEKSAASLEVPPVPSGPSVTVSDWADWALGILGRKKPLPPGGEVAVGALEYLPPLAPTCPEGGTAIPLEADHS